MPSVSLELAFRGNRVVLPEGVRPATVLVADGRISAVVDPDAVPSGTRTEDVGDAVLMPGVVDTHVHLNDPGRDWEGFATGTRAAAAGGITTLVDMPLNSQPVTTTRAALEAKLAAARPHAWVDLGFWGGVVPGNAGELEGLVAAGVRGFKAFLCPSGIDEYPPVTEADLRVAMPILARAGVPLLVHAELEGPVAATGGDPRRYATYLASRPAEWEVAAIRLVIRLARETGCRVHVVHLSAADALADLAAARVEGVPISAETCPHYLLLAAEEVPDGATAYKCAPPIRERGNRERLWEGLRAGVLDFVACDHSPCNPTLKRLETGDFLEAWGGISSLQASLPVLWTAARERGVGLPQLATWISGRTAAFAGFAGKGAIAPGRDADLVAWRPDAPRTIAEGDWLHRHPLSPYTGRPLVGVVEATWLRGQRIYDGRVVDPTPRGRLLLEPRTLPRPAHEGDAQSPARRLSAGR